MNDILKSIRCLKIPSAAYKFRNSSCIASCSEKGNNSLHKFTQKKLKKLK